MTSNHYETLGVAPGAEDAVIRAAYRALMRLYHPDTNPDPGAQAKAREITAAFFIVGNPERRAAYDAVGRSDSFSPEGPRWVEQPHRGPPPMRNLGIAAVALALVSSVTVAMWPGSAPQTRAGPAFTKPVAAEPVTPPALDLPARDSAALEPPPEAPPAAIEDPVDPAPLPSVDPVIAPRPAHAPKPAPARRIRPPESPRMASAPTVASPPKAPTSVRREPPAQVERMASNFLKQSLEHADWKKQQLLLSTQIRSRTSRNLCQSAECVTKVYLRQMQETTAIMEGRVPGQ